MMDRRNTLDPTATRRPADWRRLSRGLPGRAVMTALAFVCLSCAGGSGSGGFDISAKAENEAIVLALANKRCQPGEGVTICPANETELDVPVPGMPAPQQGVDITTTVDPFDAERCGISAEPICRLAVLISVAGLTPGSAYQLAARGVEPLTSWVIDSEATVVADDVLTSFPSFVAVPSSSPSVQVAVLAFLGGVGTTTGELRTLTETGASFAFVTAPLPIPRQ